MRTPVRRVTSLLAVGVTLCACAPASAVTLGDVVAALAAPAGAPQPTGDWNAFAQLKGAKWQGNAPRRGGDKYYWNAKTSFDRLGPGEVSLVGTQKTVVSATATVQKKVELPQIQQVVAAQLPNDARVEQVRGACPGEGMSGSRIYRVTLAGRKPIFLHAQSVTEDRGGSYSTFEMEPQRNALWTC